MDSGGFWGILEILGDSGISGDSVWILVDSEVFWGFWWDSGASGDSGGI